MTRHLQAIASISLILLIAVCLAWEAWLAPLRPGGSLLVLKAVPLLLPLRGILGGRRYTYQWTSMFILIYFTEGTVRAWSDSGMAARFGIVEIFLALLIFTSSMLYSRQTAPSRNAGGTLS